jgi:non-heme chloroperoxidase
VISRRTALLAAAGLPLLAQQPANAAQLGAASRGFETSDGVRLHYLETRPVSGVGAEHVLVLIPGWTMPAWIFSPQLLYFGQYCRVIALDPRGQGDSEIPATGYTAVRRGQDIAELIDAIGAPKVVLGGWSLGVLDSLAYVGTHGSQRLSGLVLVDNSVGESPPPHPETVPHRGRGRGPVPYPIMMRSFVRGMFRSPQSPAYLDRLTATCLITPEPAARALLDYRVPRSYWREAVYAAGVPILYCVRPGLAGQAGNLARNDPQAVSVIFPNAGHALFIDQATRFNTVLANFLSQRVWA